MPKAIPQNAAGGLGSPLQPLNPPNVVAQRAPTTRDTGYETGTQWVDVPNNAVYVLTSTSSGSAVWSTSPASGVGTFTSVDVDPGDLTVVSGNAIISAGDLDVTAGNVTIGGNLDVTGNVSITGDFDITDTASISITSTNNAAGAITLATNGGTSETLVLTAMQGTGVASVNINSVAGGITLSGALATADAINLVAASGGIDMDGALQINIASSQDAAGAVTLVASAGGIDLTATGAAAQDIRIVNTGGSVIMRATESAADSVLIESTLGGIDILASGAAAGEDIDIIATGSSVNIASTENAAGAITLATNGGTSETMTLTVSQGTGAASLALTSTAGGITLTSNLATADGVNINAIAGGVDVDGALQVNIASSQAAAADSVRIVASAADGGMDIDAGTGGITIDSTGAFSIDGAAASNVTTTGAGIDLTLSSVLGSVLVSSTEDAALAIRLHANGGTSETIQIHSDQGIGVGSVNLLSDVGGLTLRATGLASADAINLEAVAGGIDADAALQINIASSQAAASAIRLVASDAGGGFDIDAGTGGFIVDTTGAISLDAAAASNFTATGAFDVTVSSTAGSINISGGEAAADAINIDAAAGGLDVDVALQMNLTSSQAAADAVRIFASNAAGGIDVDAGTTGMSFVSTGGPIALTAGTGSNGTVTITSTGTGDVVLDSDDTMLLDADGVLELNSSAGAINIGNDADANAINIGSAGSRAIQMGNATAGTTVYLLGPANVGITLQNLIRVITGAGSPNTVVTAPAGSLYLRSDPAGATSRLYINTDSATNWTNITCAA